MWKFTNGSDGRIAIEPASRFDENTETAILDWLETDVGPGLGNVRRYRSTWAQVRDGTYEAMSGNGTRQSLAPDGGVQLESLYDQWEDVTLTVGEFEEILDRYTAYLGEKKQG